MIEKIIELSIRNRFLVLIVTAGLTLAGVFAMFNTPIDAIPDLSENQVIVFTDWMGRSPREIEDQVTYPLSRKLQGLAGVRAVRSSSEFNFSMITIIFEDSIDFYFARQRVSEKLAQANTFLPAGVAPYLAPDATALGQIFWYTVEASAQNKVDPERLWALNKFYIAPQLNAAQGVADVAIVGGTPLEYQIDVRPEALRAYGITLGDLYSAVGKSNMPSGGGVIQKNNAEYIVRGVGWIKGKEDIEDTVVKEVNGTPIYVKTVAKVSLGTQFRRSVYEKDGNEVTGGAVLMRHGENPLAVTKRIKERIHDLRAGLPAGVHIVPAYDRTRLITGAIHTLAEVMAHEMIIASIAILLILMHLRSVFVICITLPLAVLFSFLMMWVLRRTGIIDIQANIMSLAGITISIGILVDQAIVMVENATHHLKDHFGDKKVTGDTRELVIGPCRTVGRPIFFSVLIMLLSFVPVFLLSGREGQYFHPLAYTKSFAMIGVALISITVVPALIPTFIRGRLRSEEENAIVRSFIHIYKPLLTWALPRRNLVMWAFAALLIMAAGMFPLQALFGLGTSYEAWKTIFLVVFFFVTSLTVISITGRFGGNFRSFASDLLLCALGLGLIALAGSFIALGERFAWIVWHSRWFGEVPIVKWLCWLWSLAPLIGLWYLAHKTQRRMLWRTMTLASLILLGLWSYSFTKIGVIFMPPLDEGTTLDMPSTIPRASITQSSDDLKARDALLRGFPEVESVIGKAGRADTPTDPAPLDMVETFINFRPKELWPKRVLYFADAVRQVQSTLTALEDGQYVQPPETKADRDALINDAAQKALERFDEAMRGLALVRYKEVERDLEPQLTRFAVAETLRLMHAGGKINWPAGVDEDREIEKLTSQLTPAYGVWLSKNPSPEDAGELSRAVAEELKKTGAIDDVVTALEPEESYVGSGWNAIKEFVGFERPTFTGQLLQAIEQERTRQWQVGVRQIDWELFDRGVATFTRLALEEVAKAATHSRLAAPARSGAETAAFAEQAVRSQLGKAAGGADFKQFDELRQQLQQPFAKRVFLWPRQPGAKGDLVDDEMGRVVQMPGWGNVFTQPIINRIDMLSTGVRTNIGVKVFGEDLPTIIRICSDIESVLKPITGARDVLTGQISGKGYLQIDIDRKAAARYGISVEDIQNEIEVALAGRAVTYTVEKRDRFPVRIRYVRSQREDEDSIRKLLIAANSTSSSQAMGAPSSSGGGSTGMSSNESKAGDGNSGERAESSADHVSTPAHAGKGKALIPLSAVATVKIVEGPAMIKSENGRLLNYVTLNVRGRDIVGFVDEAQRVVAQKVKLPPGVHIEWSGEFEHQVRAARTLRLVIPVVIGLIFIILYLTYKDWADALLMMLAVPEALAGGAFFMFFFPKIMNGWSAPPMDFSLVVWVGFIACFGMATETGIIMLVYLREAIDKRGGLENIQSLAELREAVIEGAVHRLRPKLLTEGVAIIAIFPMVFAKGVGGEILAPMALPVLGGLLISDEVVDLFLPVRFYWVRRARWLKMHKGAADRAG